VQITTNDAANNSLKLSSLDLKVAQLVQQFANKPLLIEKLALIQSKGLLLNLSGNSNGKPVSGLELQLPLKAAHLFENITQDSSKLSLTIVNKKHIQLNLLTPTVKPNSVTTASKADNLSTTSELNTAKQLIFQKALLSADGVLKLTNPKQQTLQIANSDNHISKPNNSENQLKPNELTVAQAAKNILKNHFSNQIPISTHFKNILKINETLSQIQQPQPVIGELRKHFNDLLSSIEKATNYSAKEIKQKIGDSGYFLERNLRKLIQAQAESKTQHHLGNTLHNKSNVNQATQAGKQSAFSAQTGDVKLILLKIRTTLESLLKTIESLPTNKNKIPDSQRLLIEQLTHNLPNKQNQQSSSSNPALKNHLVNLQLLSLRQTSEMLTTVQNAISQIESNQLLSLKNETPNLHQFLIDLPVKNNSEIDSFEILFEHSDNNRKNQKIKRWKVVVRFDLEPLGPMFAQVELQNEKISTHFFAKKQQTAALINQHLHHLKQSLFSAGVEVEKLEGNQGKIPDTLLRNNEQLVDTHV